MYIIYLRHVNSTIKQAVEAVPQILDQMPGCVWKLLSMDSSMAEAV